MADSSDTNLENLLDQLGSNSSQERETARNELVRIGPAAVPQLLDTLGASQHHVRWEAAKSLAEIADPSAAERLVVALGDENADVRWVVGNALIALGPAAVKPLLTRLSVSGSGNSDRDEGADQGAHHVLHDLAKHADLAALLEPVLRAFKEPEPKMAIPVAAAEALHRLTP